MVTEPVNPNLKPKVNLTSTSGFGHNLDKIKVNTGVNMNNITPPSSTITNSVDKKKLKEDYKKAIKEKNYSRSIDTNIPKNKIGQMSVNPGLGNFNVNTDAVNTNRIKINKAKK